MLRLNPSDSYLRSMLTSICLRRPKNAVQLPCRTDRIRKLEFNATEAQYYRSMNDFVTTQLEQEAGQNNLRTCSTILAKINSLRQICNLGMHYETDINDTHEARGELAEMQDTFDGMLSAGMAVCSKCDRDLVQEDSDSFEGPQITTCREIICASCFGQSGMSRGTSHIDCHGQTPCKLFSVSLLGPVATPANSGILHPPVKMRALQIDLLALPAAEKRYEILPRPNLVNIAPYICASIVFSFWTTTLDHVCLALAEVGIAYSRVDGKMTLKERQQSLISFTEDPETRVLALSLRCGSTG